MARPRKGSLYWTKSGWRARVTMDVDGIEVRKSFDLETRDRAAAKAKLRRLVRMNAPEPEEAAASVTVAEYAEGWLARREALGVAATKMYERRYIERVWIPAIGRMPLEDVGKGEIQDVLDAAATGELRPKPRKDGEVRVRFGRQSVKHIRGKIVRLSQAAWKEELVPENRAARTDVPDMEEDGKARPVLTDAELGQLTAHPNVDAEIKMLVLLSRTVGGFRAGDLNALDWMAFGAEFATCTLVRRKTRRKKPAPVTFEVPADVRPFVEAWWRLRGEPVAGPVFPVRRGPRAGKTKKASNMSYAERLRKELIKAGVTRHELHVETPTTLPVDFHSTRRAYSQALARANVNEQTAMALTGHSDSKVHQR